MAKTLDEILGLDARKNHMIAEIITAMNTKHPHDRLHLIAHLEAKIADPKDRACSEELDQLCDMIIHNYGVNATKIIIEQITPSEQDMALAQFMAGLMGMLNTRGKH